MSRTTIDEMTLGLDLGRTPARAKLVGIGTAGCNVLDYLVMNRVGEFDLCAVNTDILSLKSCMAPDQAKLQIGRAITFGLGAGGDPAVGEAARQRELLDALGDAQVVFIAAGLGGGTGGAAARVVADLARRQGITAIGLVTIPFAFEGERRREQAMNALAALRGSCDAIYTFPYDRLVGWLESGASVPEAFNLGYELIAQTALGMRHVLTRPGLIPLADEQVFRVLECGEPNSEWDCWFGWGRSEGEGRTDNILRQIAEFPMFGMPESRAQAQDVLVAITGGRDLTLDEVLTITHFVRGQFDPRADVLIGANVDEAYGPRVHVMVLGSRGAPRRRRQTQRVEPQPARERAPDALPFNPGNPAEPAQPQPTVTVAPPNTALPEPPALIPAQAQPKVHDPQLAEDWDDANGPRQEVLTFDGPNRGQFDRVDATIYKGENLDLPTFLRRSVKARHAAAPNGG